MKLTRERSSGKIWSFLRENGIYVFLAAGVDRPLHFLRNRMLAARFGVKRINIGPRAFLRGLAHIDLGEDLAAGDGLWLEAITRHADQTFSPRLSIGNHVRISHWAHIACTHSVTIGDHVLMGSKVIITDHNHGIFGPQATSPVIPPADRPLEDGGFVRIEANVWLGDGVVVCPGVT